MAMKAATPKAASASPCAKPARVAARPMITSAEETRSLEKCSASAASASLCVSLATASSRRARTKSTTIDRASTGEDRPAGVDLDGRGAEPLRGLAGDDEREAEQEPGLDQGGEQFDLAVAIMVLLVRRLLGLAHGDIGEHCGGDVGGRMAGLRDQRQRAGGEARRELGERQHRAGGDRRLRGRSLARRLVGRDRLIWSWAGRLVGIPARRSSQP